MYYKWGKPNKENYQDVVIKYYTFFEDNFGKDILRKNTKKQLAKENYTNSLLLMDDNFKKTISVMFSIFDDENIKFLTIYNQNHQNLGYSRVNLCAGGNKDNAIVGEIVLSEALDEQSKFTIYSAVINYLEKYMKAFSPETEILTFEVPQLDMAYINAISSYGYALANESNKDLNIAHTYLFDKNIREERNTRTV
ncbi:unknown [Mycoplasma sp. CAG:472]|nr:unknown [Mycoplasma sp. CAG:472]